MTPIARNVLASLRKNDTSLTRDQQWQFAMALNHAHIDRRDESDIDTQLYAKWQLMETINKCAVDGYIWVSESGMDCDCVRYSGSRLRQIPATIKAFRDAQDRMYESAEGTCALWIHAPNDLPEYHSRDLVAEAFEDGHAHCVYA